MDRYSSNYIFEIRKADHPRLDGSFDLHVHVHFVNGGPPSFLGRYRLPSLEPVFPGEPELNRRELGFLRKWLAKPQQVRKLEDFARETLFNLHQIGELMKEYSEVETDEEGDTFILVRIPVTKRIE